MHLKYMRLLSVIVILIASGECCTADSVSSTESFFIELPTDGIAITHGGNMALASGPPGIALLHEAGVAVEYRCYTGTIHGFLSFAGVLDAGRDALKLMAERLRAKFGPQAG